MSLVIEQQMVPLQADQNNVIRVGNTRVTLDTVVHAFEQGHTAEEIAAHYPALRVADIYAVIAYYLNHQTEVQAYLQQQTKAIAELWESIEAKSDYQQFRQRLIARYQASAKLEST
ncbi:MAG: DUF433 domain-containing protein [Caldilineaceae bacterium]